MLFLLLAISFYSCEKDTIEIQDETSDINYQSDLESFEYTFKGKKYTYKKLQNEFPDLLSEAFVLFEDNHGYIFDDESEALTFDGSFSKAASCKNDNNNFTWGFKVRFYEHENYRGRWWQYRKFRIPVQTFKVGGNVPSWLNDRTSSIVIDELDYSKHKSGQNYIGLTCYEDYGMRGKRTYAQVGNIFARCYRTFDNLRKGDWNDKISSWSVNGGGF